MGVTNKGIRKGWKVFYVGQDKNHDLFSYTLHNPIKYVKDEWTERPIDAGPLTVFTHKSYAEEFLFSDQNSYNINDEEDVKTKTIISTCYNILPIYYVQSNDTILWYRTGASSLSTYHRTLSIDLPFGTDFADLVFVPQRSLQDPDVINPSICSLY